MRVPEIVQGRFGAFAIRDIAAGVRVNVRPVGLAVELQHGRVTVTVSAAVARKAVEQAQGRPGGAVWLAGAIKASHAGKLGALSAGEWEAIAPYQGQQGAALRTLEAPMPPVVGGRAAPVAPVGSWRPGAVVRRA